MAYVIPTAAELIARYPAFAAVAEATINIHIADASTTGVDTSWLEDDYAPAIAALAAHNMALLNIGDHGEATSYARAGLTRIRSGAFDASFSDKHVSRAAAGGFDASPYGQAYWRLLRKNKAGPRIAMAPEPPGDWGHVAQLNNGGFTPWAS